MPSEGLGEGHGSAHLDTMGGRVCVARCIVSAGYHAVNGSHFVTLAEMRVGRGPEGQAHIVPTDDQQPVYGFGTRYFLCNGSCLALDGILSTPSMAEFRSR